MGIEEHTAIEYKTAGSGAGKAGEDGCGVSRVGNKPNRGGKNLADLRRRGSSSFSYEMDVGKFYRNAHLSAYSLDTDVRQIATFFQPRLSIQPVNEDFDVSEQQIT